MESGLEMVQRQAAYRLRLARRFWRLELVARLRFQKATDEMLREWPRLNEDYENG